MMPGPHMPPAVPTHPGRRQGDYHHHYLPPQTHSPIPHNPYYPPHYHGPPHASPYPAQWYNPYAAPQQYSMPPRTYQPPGTPVVVSSHPHIHNVPPINRQFVQTPPIVHSHTPPIPQSQTPHAISPTPPAPSQAVVSPPTPTTTTSTATPPQSVSKPAPQPSQQTPLAQLTHKMPFYPKLPWLSVPEEPFPPGVRRRRRRREQPSSDHALELPTREKDCEAESTQEDAMETVDSQASTVPAVSDVDTPTTSQAPSESGSTHPTTPASSLIPPSTPRQQASGGHGRTATRPAVPLIPIKSTTQAAAPAPQKATASPSISTEAKSTAGVAAESKVDNTTAPTDAQSADKTPTAASPPAKSAPKSWADLVRSKVPPGGANNNATAPSNGVISANGVIGSQNSLADVIRSFSVDSDNKVAFLEPRGLVNTGNMCYMNSILQVLVFCVAFYDFLDQIGKQAAHSFKSETPLLDAMIMFMREFNVIDSASSVDQLRMRLKDMELEQYGEPFAPEYVYDVIRRLPRFAHMRGGHQQDAEEFLGFLLAGLHDECVQVLKSSPQAVATESESKSPTSESSVTADGWLEVGPKQKAAITRSSGHIETESPITKIFGGKLRSELRVPGLKNSVTLEPYQPLQLDIGSPTINNITDALKGLTHPETLQGDFGSPRGPGTSATKQVFIETLPPVLILHLKRFQYDNTGGTQKIWKKVGYPLELEIPKEVFPPHKRGGLAAHGGLPKYKLISVVYHHGKNASGGHYTVDVRRQDGREWIRMDDTVLRRVRSEDVAEGGSEEDLRVLAKALDQHTRDASQTRNFYDIGNEEENDRENGGWSQVNGATNGTAKGADKKWSGVVNGNATPSSAGKLTPRPKEGAKDNKVAYILFYQQIK